MSPAGKAWCDWRCTRCGHDVREFPDRQWRHDRLHSSSNVVPDCPGEVTAWCPVHGGTPDNQGNDRCQPAEGPGRRHRQIDVIAGTIAAMTRGDDLADGLAQARAINAGGGWTIEVRYARKVGRGGDQRTKQLDSNGLDSQGEGSGYTAQRLAEQLPAEEAAQ